jgi:hypothetical protein
MKVSLTKILTSFDFPIDTLHQARDRIGNRIPVPSLRKAKHLRINKETMTTRFSKPLVLVFLKSRIRREVSGYSNLWRIIFKHSSITVEWEE